MRVGEANLVRAEMLVVTAENSGTEEIAVETHIVILAMTYLPAFSDFLVFLITCAGPASASRCAGSA